MNIPDPFLGHLPLSGWLGFLSFVLILTQISIGRGIFKVPFEWHTQVVWKAILVLIIIHALYSLTHYI